jgi:tetratricopeptide (TPR) repeat protein
VRARSVTIASLVGVAVLAVGAVIFVRTKVRPKPAPPTPRPLPTAKPAPLLQWTSHNEEEWLVGEVARDILEMVVSAKGTPLLGKEGLPVVVSSLPGAEASYEVTGPIGPEAPPFKHRIILYDHAWAATNYEGLARAAIERLQMKASTTRAPRSGSVLSSLLDLRPETIEQENTRVSAGLATDMMNPVAHEEAALVLGAFALREDAGAFADTRTALCRMTAHLALARALLAPAPPGAEGDYARLVQTTLIGRQREAVDEIARLRRARTTPYQRAWLLALAMRNNGDWRLAGNPSRASLLERVEYVRALKRSQGGLKALEFLSRQRVEPAAQWTRIGLAGKYHPQVATFTVEEGNTFAGAAIGLEMKEWASVWKRLAGEELKHEDAVPSLNRLAGRCVWHPGGTEVGPRVIDRGLWSAFAQRHLLSAVRETELYLEKLVGLPEEAATFREETTKEFAGLTLFPPLREQWDRGPVSRKPGGPPPTPNPDAGRCLASLDLVRRRPEVVSAPSWLGLIMHCNRARQENAFVDPKSWFSTRMPMGTVYDFEHRAYIPELKFTPQEVEGLAALAPYDKSIIYWRVSRRPPGSKLTSSEFDAIYGPMVAYDADAKGTKATRVQESDVAFKASAKRACDASPDQCLRVAEELVERDAIEEAVHAYERALARAPDRVDVSNSSGWLVQHYFEQGKTERALEVARMCAAVQSAGGFVTLGQLLERMGRYDEAERTYIDLAKRYPEQDVRLSAFYMRSERRVADGKFRVQAAAAEQKLFPGGLKRVTLSDLRSLVQRFGMTGSARAGAPTPEGTAKELQDMGLRLGDVVVAVDGYRVINEPQYSCVIGFADLPEVKMILLRNGEYVELTGKMVRRLYGPRQGATQAQPPPGR